MQTFQPIFFIHACITYRHHWLLPFYSTFSVIEYTVNIAIYLCFLFFLIHMSLIWIYVMSCAHPSGRPAVLQEKTLVLDTLHANYLAWVFHTCYAYRYHWLLPLYIFFPDLDLTWGSQGQHETKPIGFIFSHTFPLVRMKFDVVMKQFNLTFSDCFWVRFRETRRITAVLLTASKNFQAGMHLNMYESNWFKFGMIDIIVLYIILILVWFAWVFVQGQKAQTSVISQSFQSIWMKVDVSMYPMVWWTNFHLFCPFNRQGREPYYDFVIKSLACVQTFTDWFVSAWLYNRNYFTLHSVCMTLTFMGGKSFMRNQKLWCPFSCKSKYRFGWNSVCCHNLFVCWNSC